jgi:hypothetical protein
MLFGELWPLGYLFSRSAGMKSFLVVLLFGFLFGLLLLEWMVGCGEVTYLSDRTWQSNDCLFLPSEIIYGIW